MSDEVSGLRLVVVGAVVISLFAALFARLSYLQVLDSEQFRVEAARNQIRVVCEPAPRGRILDRYGTVLVENRATTAITVDRSRLSDRPPVKPRLAALLGISLAELDKRLADPRYSPYRPLPVAQDVPFDKVVYLREHSEELPGVDATVLHERSYPKKDLAAHLLGYLGEINADELKAHRPKAPSTDQALAPPGCQDYELGDSIGKGGIEQVYDQALRGHPGVSKLEVDRSGRVLRRLAHTDPVPGLDVVLTLDASVQKLAEDSLAQGIDEARRNKVSRSDPRNFEAPGGAAVVLDPRSGSVLALASYPSYDPADFVGGIGKAEFDAYNNDPGHPLTNRAVSGQYAPGSTFKLFTATAALDRGVIEPNTTFVDNGVYTVGGKCRGKCQFQNPGKAPHGRVALPQALTVSSDVFFYRLADVFWSARDQYGVTAIQDQARAMGLDSRTGVDLAAEAPGRVSDPDRRKRDHDQHPDVFPEGRWFVGDNLNLAVGQGETLVTPLQLANAYATFANGGTLYQPRAVLREQNADGSVARELGPVTKRQMELSPAVREPILLGLNGVVSRGDGTAAGAFSGFPSQRYPLAGKTGTAQVQGKQDTALFVGFGPLPDPQFTVAVVLEQAGFGGQSAAPVARRIFDVLSGGTPGQVRTAERAGAD